MVESLKKVLLKCRDYVVRFRGSSHTTHTNWFFLTSVSCCCVDGEGKKAKKTGNIV